MTLWHADAKDVLPLLPDDSVDFVWTDPPYVHNNNNGDLIHRREAALGERRKSDLIGDWERAPGRAPSKQSLAAPSRPIANDGPVEASALVRWAFAEFARLLSPGCCCCCGGGGPDPQFARWSLWLDEAVGFKQMVVWDKGPMGMGWHYRRSYETVLVGEKPGAACRWFDETKRVENIVRPGVYGVKKIIPSKHEHATEKPVELAEHFIRLHTRRGDLVLDPFLGSGSTALACLRLGRRFYGCDLDRVHVDLTIDRIKNREGGGMLTTLRKLKRVDARTRA